MGASIAIRIGDAASAGMAAVVARIDHPRGFFDDIGAALVVSTQERFDRETGPDGNPWPRSIRALADGGRTLTDTARLRNSITHLASDDQVAVGTNVPYAGTHQGGAVIRAKTSRGLRFRAAGNGAWVTKESVTIPPRPFLGLDAGDEAMIARRAESWISGDGHAG